jgi:phosphatidate cytidylyltransferase
VSEFSKRVIVGLLLIAVASTALWFGGMAFWGLATLGGLIMLSEFGGLLKVEDKQRRLAMFALCIPLGVIAPIAADLSFFSIGLLIGMAVAIITVTRNPALGGGMLYVGLPVFALLWMREQPGQGLLYAFWALSLVWATDIGAFFAGRAIGGPKIAPKISPNKTWAGLCGGMLGALALGLVLHHYHGLPLLLALASPILAVFAQVGDFFESWMKRKAGVKDSGTLLPGHGGVLDRLDGVVTSAPIAALLLVFVNPQTATLPKPSALSTAERPIMIPTCMLDSEGNLLSDQEWREACRKVQK